MIDKGEEEGKETHDQDDFHDHLDAKVSACSSIASESTRFFSFNHEDDNHQLRRRNSSTKVLSGFFKSITFQRSSRSGRVPKCNGPKEKVGNNIRQANSSYSSSSSGASFLSPSTSISTSTSLSSSEIDNIEAIPLKRSSIARSNSVTFHHKKRPKTIKSRDKALKSSPNQEGFLFYLVTLALVLVVLCGKSYAIMLTSLFLYFTRFHLWQRPEYAVKLPQEKRRINVRRWI